MVKEKEQESTETKAPEQASTEPRDILEEVEVEDLTVDGICGVY
jgi:mycofactocin precursor